MTSEDRPAPTADLFDTMRTARAIRRFRPDPVPDEVLLECLEAATWAPSGSNRQGWRFVVLRSPEARALLGRAYRRGWTDKAGPAGMPPPAPDDTSPRAKATRAMQHFVEHFEEIPAYVLFCVHDKGRRPHVTDGGSIYPAMQNFLLAARAAGLGAVVTMWFTYCEKELRELIGIPDDFLLAALVPVGYPQGSHGPVRRRPVAEVAFRDRWGESLASG
ncbi:MAG TPA: nitroreductase family protein [Acidimicrobiales bacterium]|nr:nitroreductase family protein [Acidimicrobiales bacterium]